MAKSPSEAILGESADPKTAMSPFCESCARPPLVHGLQSCFASTDSLDLTAQGTGVLLPAVSWSPVL